jgi:hypothetical protein
MSTPQPAPATVAKYRAWTTAAKSFALGMLPICGDNLARTIKWLHDNRYSVYGPGGGQQPATVDHLRYWRKAVEKEEQGTTMSMAASQ